MWTISRFEDSNVQEFKRTKGKYTDTIYSPIFIGDGRYEIKSILSVSGGFGIIYNAIDKRLNDRKVLIKARRYDNESGLFLFKDDNKRLDKIRKIRSGTHFEYDALVGFKTEREARMPNVNNIVEGFCPSIYGPHKDLDGDIFFCEDNELCNKEPYIVMQIIDGETLAQYVDDGIDVVMKRRGFDKLVQWERCVLEYAKELTSILQGFHHIQERNGRKFYYIYQDLKPDNIMITSDKVITLLDFGGITVVVENKDGSSNSNIPNGGSPGLGTFGYSAPEMNNPTMLSKLDRRVDVYTLGATIYHLLTGEKLNEVLTPGKERIPVENLEGKYTSATCELVRKCTEMDRNKRYQTMDDVRRQIVNVCFGELKNA